MNYKPALLLNLALASFSLFTFINKVGKGGNNLQLYASGIAFILFTVIIVMIVRKRKLMG